MNNYISTLLGVSLTLYMGQAMAMTTDLILKADPDYSEDAEAIFLKTNHGKFAFQRAPFSDAINAVLMKAKKGTCLSISTDGKLTNDSTINSIANCQQAPAPNFAAYPVDIYSGQRWIPIAGRFKDMRDELTSMAKQKIDFAGQYVTGGWSCGSGCYSVVLLNVKTAQAQYLGDDTNMANTNVECKGRKAGIATQANSRLMVVTGAKLSSAYDGDPVECISQSYLEQGGKLILMK